jgi:hypothetical protein
MLRRGDLVAAYYCIQASSRPAAKSSGGRLMPDRSAAEPDRLNTYGS